MDTKNKAVNFMLPISLIERLKIVAIAKSYEIQQPITWTDVVRETLADHFPIEEKAEVVA